MPIAIEIMPEAQRMVEEADERWTDEHGFVADNPLLEEILHADARLRENPQIGVLVRRERFRSEVRRLLLRSGWHLYYRFHAERELVEIVAVCHPARSDTDPPRRARHRDPDPDRSVARRSISLSAGRRSARRQIGTAR